MARRPDRRIRRQTAWTTVPFNLPRSVASTPPEPAGIPAFRRGVDLISGAIGSLPVWAYDQAGTLAATQPTVLVNPVPDPVITRTVALQAWVEDLVVHGNALAVITPARSGPVLTPIPAQDVYVRADPVTGDRVYRVYDLELPVDEVWHVQGQARPGELRGRGVIETHLATWARISAEETYARDAFLASGVPSGILKVHTPRLREGEAAALKADWVAAFARSSREPAVLSDAMDWSPVGWSPEDTELLAARQASVSDVARILGLPSYWLDGGASGQSITYANVSQSATNLLRFSLAPHLARLEAALTRLLPRGQYARFDLDPLLREAQPDRYAAWKTAIEAGFLTVEEVRLIEGIGGSPHAV